MKVIRVIRSFGHLGCHSHLFSRQLLNCGHKLISVNQSAYYKTGSFLTEPNGVKTFVDLLGSREQQMLMQELSKRRELILPVNGDSQPENKVIPPNFKQMSQIAFHQSLPFIGFGFLDNAIMILAGEYIDTTLGVTLGISTMAAAGLGNAISDVAGIGSAWYVETLANKIGVAYPKLTPAQTDMMRTRLSVQIGRAVGILIGCILGMSPLLFYSSNGNNSRESKENLDSTNQKVEDKPN
ncbi:transmembrane protein 65-like [Panonychus citri]|uniref:transmembrane protein 65-like n=1 Tax=Panonychus citri TaxID=50023 RepID=UPI00230718F4|nr:transmembrane protein 65-like [Panonychus citri]